MKTEKRNNTAKLNKIVFPAMVILMIAAIALIFVFMNHETKIRTGEPVYQFFMEQKAEYGKDAAILESEQGLVFEENGETNAGDVSPIYASEAKAIYLAEDMYWVDPEGDREWRLPAFQRLEMDEDGVIWYGSGDDRIRMNSGFLYNGRGTCVLLEPAEVLLNQHSYQADAFSFYSSAAGLYRLYLYGEDVLEFEEERNSNTTVWGASGFHADLTTGLYTAPDGTQRLLVSSPAVLKGIEER